MGTSFGGEQIINKKFQEERARCRQSKSEGWPMFPLLERQEKWYWGHTGIDTFLRVNKSALWHPGEKPGQHCNNTVMLAINTGPFCFQEMVMGTLEKRRLLPPEITNVYPTPCTLSRNGPPHPLSMSPFTFLGQKCCLLRKFLFFKNGNQIWVKWNILGSMKYIQREKKWAFKAYTERSTG